MNRVNEGLNLGRIINIGILAVTLFLPIAVWAEETRTITVSFEGRSAEMQEIAAPYIVLPCAKATLEAGYDYFVVVDTELTAASDVVWWMPAGKATIQLFHGQAPLENPLARDAVHIVKRFE